MTNTGIKEDVKEEERSIWSPVTLLDNKCRRTLQDFKNFCNFILAYEASLETSCHDVDTSCDLQTCRSPSSPSTASCSSAEDSLTEEARPMPKPIARKRSHENEEYNSDDESWSAVTCYCEKPFAGRPMIECSHCLTWIHLSCAKIRKSNIPELFVCHLCRDRNPRITNFVASSSSTLLQGPEKQKRKGETSHRRRSKTPRGRKKNFSDSEQPAMSLIAMGHL